VSGDIWVGAAAALAGATFGGAISFVVHRQQLRDAREQRAEEALREQHRRSEDRRFAAYADFLTRARSFRNSVRAYCLPSGPVPDTSEVDALMLSANVASALVFLVAETARTTRACHNVLEILAEAQSTVREASAHVDPWSGLSEEIGQAMREFENAARAELEIKGAERPWIAPGEAAGQPGSSGNSPEPASS